MAAPNWSALYVASSTEYTINEIQSVSYSLGRRWATDPYGAGTCTIVCRDPSSWTAPKPAMGRECYVYSTDQVWSGFAGKISDVQIVYGITSDLDYAQITVEGVLADVGRNTLTSEVFTQKNTGDYAYDIATLCDVAAKNDTGLSIASAQTYSGNALDLLNEVMFTESGRLAEVYNAGGFGESALRILNRNSIGNGYGTIYELSDVAADWTAGQIKYNDLQFKSAAENYYTKATVAGAGIAKQSSGTGKRVLYLETLDYDTTQASNHAQYLKELYAKQTITPYAVSFDYLSQPATSQSAFLLCLQNVQVFGTTPRYRSPISGRMVLKFRGSTYNTIIEGFDVDADPENTRITFYFSSDELNNVLLLDDTVYGLLDTGQLGF